jgi:hypothetical protein
MLRGPQFSRYLIMWPDGVTEIVRVEPDPEPLRRLIAPCPCCGTMMEISDWADGSVTVEVCTPEEHDDAPP